MEKLAVMHPELKNAGEITDMIVLCDIIDHGVPDITLSDLLHMWSNIDISKNAWIVRSEMNEIIGYAFLDVRGEDRMDTCVFVHPEFKNKGIGSMLLSIVEERAIILKKEKEMPQQLMNHIPHTNEFAKNIVSKKGYEFKRLYQRMKIILEKEPQIVCLSAGMRILPFQPGKDENNLYEVYDETFKDSWGYSKIEAAEWIKQQKGEDYDPSLWFIVWEHDKPVGFLMSRVQEDGLFVDYLGVKRQWRKQGIGLALLRQAFLETYKRGQSTVLLYVDTDSLTNAQRLYAQAGMSPDLQTALYRKML